MTVSSKTRRLAAALALGATALAASAPLADAAPVPKIVNGGVVTASTPWMAALAVSPSAAASGASPFDRQFCGGTLMAPRVVVTAAHCVVDDGVVTPAAKLSAILGRQNLNGAGGEEIQVTQVSVHPGYAESHMRNDVAVLQLARPSAGTPAGFMEDGMSVAKYEMATVLGWGKLQEGGASPENLMAVDVPVWSDAECQSAYPVGGAIAPYDAATMTCAGFSDGVRDACQGDSGGPLMVHRAGTWRLFGVVSYGEGCARAGKPTNYAWLGARSALRTWTVERLQALSAPAPQPTQVQTAPAPAPVQGTAPSQTAADAAPAIFSLSATRRTFRRSSGTTLRTSVSEAATLTFTLSRRSGGRHVRVATLRRGAHRGVNRTALSGRRLRRGTYRVTVVARDAAGNRSARRALRLRVR